MSAMTVEERLSRLEGGADHLATKADVYRTALWLIVTLGGLMLAGFTISLYLIRLWLAA